MASLVDSRLTKRDSEVFRVTEQQFEECKVANENGAAYVLEPKDGECIGSLKCWVLFDSRGYYM